MNEFEPQLELETVEVKTPVVEPEAPTMASKWKDATTRWAKESSLAYLSNPAARRDFRVQFRGNRSAWLFGIYIIALGVVSLYEYWKIANMIDPSAQRNEMENFEELLFVSLALIISLVTPALSATVVLAERQRKSLDLVFVAPIRPRTYLVGKILASYRYTWILLALSLPFTAMSVIMGGASWGDILTAYFLLSLQGVIFTSIGLYFSSMVEKVFSALIYTYGAVIAYCYGTVALAALAANNSHSGFGLDSFWLALNPFTVLQAAGSFTTVFGVAVPEFAIATGVGLLIIRIVLGAAGNLLTPPRPRERAKLRTVCALSLGAFAAAIASQSSVQQYDPNVVSVGMCGLLLPLLLVIPFQACYGIDGESANKPNGVFSLKHTLTGTPAGALPYLWLLVGTTAIGTVIGTILGHGSLPASFPLFVVYAFGFWTFMWSLARLASSFLQGLKASRALHFLLAMGIIGVPVPFLLWLQSGYENTPGTSRFPWNLWILNPLGAPGDSMVPLIQGIVLMFLSLFIAKFSERNLAKRLSQRKMVKLAAKPVTAGMTTSPIFDHISRLSTKFTKESVNDDSDE